MTPRPVVAVAAGLCLGVVTVGCTDAGASRHASHEAATTSVGPDPVGAARGPAAARGDPGVRRRHALPAQPGLAARPPARCARPDPRSASADADLTMVNLESAITERGTRDPKELEDPADRYWFRASPPPSTCWPTPGSTWSRWRTTTAPTTGRTGSPTPCRAAERSPIPVVGVGRDRAAAFTPYRVTVDGTRSPSSPPTPRPARGAARSGRPAHALPGSPRPAAATARPAGGGPQRGRPRRGRGGLPALGRGGPRLPEPRAAAAWRAPSPPPAPTWSSAATPTSSRAPGWLGDTYVDYGLGTSSGTTTAVPDTGVLRLRLEDGHVVSDGWVPARIPAIGPPPPVHGRARAEAVARWRALRACAGLASRPAPSTRRPSSAPACAAAGVLRVGPPDRAGAARHGCARPTAPGARCRGPTCATCGWPTSASTARRHRGELVVAARPRARRGRACSPGCTTPAGRSGRCGSSSDYGGDDDRSMAADNTSAYNCRRVAGSDRWSDHAYGAAIDINPVENPYLHDGSVRPAAGRPSRGSTGRPGRPCRPVSIRAGDVVVRAFAEIGWEWGGTLGVARTTSTSQRATSSSRPGSQPLDPGTGAPAQASSRCSGSA